MQIGPNSLETLAVPRDCTAKSPIRTTTVIWRMSVSVMPVLIPGMVFSPSTAESTESAGVIIASP